MGKGYQWGHKRIRSQKIPNETYRIFCGGEKTEEYYFNSIRVDHNKPGLQIKTISKGVAGINLMKYVLKAIKKIQKDKLDSFFMVFDRDPGNNTPQQLEEIKKLAKDKGVELIMSNKSFEVWLLLHFDKFNKKVLRNEEYEKLLTALLGKFYQKNDPKLYEYIKDNTTNAIENAKWLEKQHIDNGEDLYVAEPYTSMHKLVEKIIDR